MVKRHFTHLAKKEDTFLLITDEFIIERPVLTTITGTRIPMKEDGMFCAVLLLLLSPERDVFRFRVSVGFINSAEVRNIVLQFY